MLKNETVWLEEEGEADWLELSFLFPAAENETQLGCTQGSTRSIRSEAKQVELSVPFPCLWKLKGHGGMERECFATQRKTSACQHHLGCKTSTFSFSFQIAQVRPLEMYFHTPGSCDKA